MRTQVRTTFFVGLAVTAIALVQFTGCISSPKATEQPPESWVSISNRWSTVTFEKIKKKAEQGDVTAQYFLAAAYFQGFRFEKNPTEAFKWMTLAANQKMPRAQRLVGWMLQNGLGTMTNSTKAAEWYRLASLQGDRDAQNYLGRLHYIGEGVEQDYEQAAYLFRLSAEQGNAMAQNNLGLSYEKGLGVERNPKEALNWYLKSAEQGEPLARKNLAFMYASGAYGSTNPRGQGAEAQIRSGGFPPNHEEAEKWMLEAVDLNTAKGQYEFACLLKSKFNNSGFHETKDFPRAAEYFRQAAELGHINAQYELAGIFHHGHLGRDQSSNCIPWYLKAAAQGHTGAQAIVGDLPKAYPNSELLKSVNTIEILIRGAENGNLDAQFQLATRYQKGDGVVKSPTEAFNWMLRASKNKTQSSRINDARYQLGLMYESGLGVSRDVAKARELFIDAATTEFSDANACFRVAQMYEKGESPLQQNDNAAVWHYYSALSGTFEYEAIESLLRLFSNNRGFPKANPELESQGEYFARIRNIPKFIEYYQGLITSKNSRLYVGEIYHQGKIVEKNLVESAAWLHLAANQDLDEARQKLVELELEMSEPQKEAATNRANALIEFFKSIP